jgi:phosphonate transport system substrate-binding protein
VVYYPVNSNSAEIEAMRSGRLHFAGFSTGPTGFAVNLAGAVPFAAKGTEKGPHGYHLISLVKASSPYHKLSDLKDKRVAHTAPSSNSGHLAPLVLYPQEGLKPNDDYKPLMSGGHDKSALGVLPGDYDMGGVASDVYERMVSRGTLKADDFRIIYKSPIFPTSSFAYAHDLKPDLAKKLVDCFYAFRFPESMRKEFNNDDRFYPITYQKDWAVVRKIAEDSGTPYNKAAYDAEAKREADALRKRSNSNRLRNNNTDGRRGAFHARRGRQQRRPLARYPQPTQGIPRGSAGAEERLADGRGPRHDRDHWSVRYR